MTEFDHFNKGLFTYLRDLEANNEREWFKARKHLYEEKVQVPVLDFVRAIDDELHVFAPHIIADDRKSRGSLLRIYRDTRFSKNKTPYKTHVGIQFKHEEGKDIHAPSYYVHLANKECLMGIGMWSPATQVLFKIRTKITEEPERFSKIVNSKMFTNDFILSGDSLKRAPKGFDPEDPMIIDLRRKSFIAIKSYTKKQVLSVGFTQQILEDMKSGNAFMEFLCEAIDVPF